MQIRKNNIYYSMFYSFYLFKCVIIMIIFYEFIYFIACDV